MRTWHIDKKDSVCCQGEFEFISPYCRLLIVVSFLAKSNFFFVIVPQHMRFYDVNVHMFGKFISVCCGWYLYYEGRGDCMTMTVSHGMIINVFYNKSH